MVCKHNLYMQLWFPHQARHKATYVICQILLWNLQLRLRLGQSHDKQVIFDNFTTAPEQESKKASQAQQNEMLPNFTHVVLEYPIVAAAKLSKQSKWRPFHSDLINHQQDFNF